MDGLLKNLGKGGNAPRTDLLPLGCYTIGCTFLMLAVAALGPAAVAQKRTPCVNGWWRTGLLARWCS